MTLASCRLTSTNSRIRVHNGSEVNFILFDECNAKHDLFSSWVSGGYLTQPTISFLALKGGLTEATMLKVDKEEAWLIFGGRTNAGTSDEVNPFFIILYSALCCLRTQLSLIANLCSGLDPGIQRAQSHMGPEGTNGKREVKHGNCTH